MRFTPDGLSQNLYSGFAQDEVSLPGNIVLTAGSKVEHNDYTGFEFEPDLRARWNPTEKQVVWAAVSARRPHAVAV